MHEHLFDDSNYYNHTPLHLAYELLYMLSNEQFYNF